MAAVPGFPAWAAWLLLILAIGAPARAEVGTMKIAVHFGGNPPVACQMAMTRDSVGLLEMDPDAGGLEPDDENGFEASVAKRALSGEDKDTAEQFLAMIGTFKGRERYACPGRDGYAFSIWADSLALHCDNCFSCTEGIGVQEARALARFGKLTLWLYRFKAGLQAR